MALFVKPGGVCQWGGIVQCGWGGVEENSREAQLTFNYKFETRVTRPQTHSKLLGNCRKQTLRSYGAPS